MNTVIVGGGISGLSLAHGLLARGQRVLLLEADARVGGTIRTDQEQGFLTEAGPNGFLDREPATRTLVEALGLSAKLRPAAPASKARFVFTRGRLRPVPSSPPAFLRSDLLPWGAKLRLAGELFSGRATEADESLATFARRHLGERAAGVLVDAMQSGIYAGDPERLSLASCFPRMAELEHEHRSLILALVRLQKAARAQRRTGPSAGGPEGALLSLSGGLSTLTLGLGERLGDAVVQTRTRVSALRRDAAGFTLTVVDRQGQRPLRADRVVLATPAHVTAALLGELDTALASLVGGIVYAPIAAVHLGFGPQALTRTPQGFGFLVPGEERRRILGALYISSLFPWRAPEGHVLLTCMVGGARRPELLSASDEVLVGMVREELATTAALGLGVPPLFSQVVRWPQGIPQYQVGHRTRLAAIDERLAALPGLHLHGNAYRGVGLNDCVRSSAELAARLTQPAT